MSFIKKLMSFRDKQEITVEAVETWVVRWESRHGEYSHEATKEAEVFTSESAAKEFCDALSYAQSILRNTQNINLEIEKNK